MSQNGSNTFAFVAMILWYVALLLGTGAMMLIGMAFGSEVYRGDPIPIEELSMTYGPFAAVAALMMITIVFWSKGRHGVAVGAWAASVVLVLAGCTLLGGIV